MYCQRYCNQCKVFSEFKPVLRLITVDLAFEFVSPAISHLICDLQLSSNCYCLYNGCKQNNNKKTNCCCLHQFVYSSTQNCAHTIFILFAVI